MNDAIFLTERQQSSEGYRMSTEVRTNLQIRVYRKAPGCMKEGVRIVYLIQAMCLDEIPRHFTGGDGEERETRTRKPYSTWF